MDILSSVLNQGTQEALSSQTTEIILKPSDEAAAVTQYSAINLPFFPFLRYDPY